VDAQLELLQGTLDMLILKAVSAGPLHGYGIFLRIQRFSEDRLEIRQGSLYPALYRLEHQGWITSEWGDSENNRKAKFYRLTPDGVKYPRQEQALWKLVSLALMTLLIHAQETYSRQSPVAMPTPSSAMPFESRSHFLILAEGQIGPLTQLKFILDTGATHTMVDTKIADRLSLPRHKGKVLNFDKQIKVDWTNLPELHLGRLVARNLPAMVGDLKRVSEFADGVDAIVGLDVLRIAESIRIDYRSHLITMKVPVDDSANSLNASALTVLVPLQGRPARLVIDTGLQGLLLYEDRLQRHLPHLRLSGTVSRASAGRLSGHAASLTGIHLGTEELQSSVLLLPKAPASLPADIDGYLGTSVFRADVIELNFASHTLRWQVPLRQQRPDGTGTAAHLDAP
jgi:PadR family transcriptional regulator, regulatory protein PadR